MNDVLLTVSGTIDPAVKEKTAQGLRPVADYIAMSEAFNADLIDFAQAKEAGGLPGRLIGKIAGNKAMLAWACFSLRKKYRLIFTDGEQIGIPLALLLKWFGGKKRPRHLMIVHILSVGKKMRFFDWFGVQSAIDTFFVYSTWQKKFIETRWQIPPERVVFTPFMVDDDFFRPGAETGVMTRTELGLSEDPVICAVGLEFRDYPTLLEAVKGLNVQVMVAAGSPWSKRSDTTQDQEIPANVIVRRFSQLELRDVYALSDFVVMPLFNVEFQAGVTAILEGMAMGKAVICSRTPGQTDILIDQVNGLYAPPEDPEALREAIQSLLQNRDMARKMGENGRQRIEDEIGLKHYVERLNAYVSPPLKD
ncbi:MAG: glycosyltransferase family 4 protein [Chloroflexota bacterium]